VNQATAADLARTDAWNARAQDDEPLRTVPALFDAIAVAQPEAIAVRDARDPLRYGQLATRAGEVAMALTELGARPGDRVAVCMARGPELAVALLGILRAGCAYVPLEPTYPGSRLAFTVADARVRWCLCDAAHADAVPGGVHRVTVAGLRPRGAIALPPGVDAEAPAYVLYTSGSTGHPKGVVVPHRAIDRLVRKCTYARLDADTVVLQAAPVAFDASTFEIWGPLLNGGSVAFHSEPVPTARGVGAAIREHGATTMWLTAALFNAIVDEDVQQLAPLRELLIGGEALSPAHVRRALARLPQTRLINGYGPTETTTFAACHPIPRDVPEQAASIPIGRAIRRTRLYVVDGSMRRVAVGAEGELLIGGDGVALGYLARPELTAERFLDDPWHPGGRLYRTGDLVRLLDDGVLDYRGRIDQQVKIRGFRVELGEVEHALAALPAVGSCCVVAPVTATGDRRLVAYVVPRADARFDAHAAREALASELPGHMVPARFVVLAALPRTPNGKLDTRALPAPDASRPALAVAFTPPATPAETRLARAWSEALGVEPLGVHDNLFELGANSLLVVRTVGVIERELGITLSPVQVFEHPTVAALAALVDGAASASASTNPSVRTPRAPRALHDGDRADVAIIGMSGRFPGAGDVETFWRNLLDGVDSVSHWRVEELDPSLPEHVVAQPGYVAARGVLDDVDRFDAGFFGISPKEAALMDPQQRVLLEEAWTALERAGYAPGTTDDVIGVFAGKYNATYFDNNVRHRPDLVAEVGAFATMLANEKDYVATRIANRLDLTGPAISTHTACSTSLVAIAQAVQALQLGQCDLALAGGVSIVVPVKSGYVHKEGEMLSPDGRTRTFDAAARGTVFSDGVALVVLKRVTDALAAGDTVHAVIRGVAVNNDGGNKASFTAPGVDGQATVIAMAHTAAGVDAASIGYVEAHGTATPLGDPIEVQALTRVFRRGAAAVGSCLLGSLKSNVGHLVIAAGAAGVVKAALALEREVIPRSLHFETPNPRLELDASPFRVVTATTQWPRGATPRYAGVSSFGVGGTNAHAVLAEPPLRAPRPAASGEQLLLVSARSEAALRTACDQLASHLLQHEEVPLADVAFTLHAGRRRFEWTRAVVARSHDDAALLLRGADGARARTQRHAGAVPAVAFLFPGQGSQHAGMANGWYDRSGVFRRELDTCAELLRAELGEDLRPYLLANADAAGVADVALQQTRLAQPALFAVGYALARCWQHWGVQPRFLAGHSVGEFVAAALAGVMDVADAARLVAARGRMMQERPQGAMLAVRAAPEVVEPLLADGVVIAAENGPQLCVVAGSTDAIAALGVRLEEAGVPSRALVTSHAFHSPTMDAVVAPFRALVASVRLSPPRIPIVSTATGTWLTAADATDPGYWSRHLRVPVRFAGAVRTLLAEGASVLLEVGPRATLTTLVRQQLGAGSPAVALPSLGVDAADAFSTMLAAAGRLHQLGVALDATAVHGPHPRGRVPLPTYPFERQRFWIDAPGRSAEPPVAASLAAVLAAQAKVMQQQLELLCSPQRELPI
jgi:amino acid adenylation domain-containing protein